MGGFFVAAGKFIAAIFVGAGAGASAAYVFAVNVARLGLLAITAKLAAPKIDFSEKARNKALTLRDTIAPQNFIYGEDVVSGPMIFANVAGTDNRDLYYCIAFAGHEVDSAQAYRIDDTDIALGDLSGAEDGTVNAGKFSGVMEIELLKGGTAQAASTLLNGAFPSLWTASHTARGWGTMVFKMTIDETNETAYENGVPRNFRIRVRGKQVYDPRLDVSPGASPNNASYITWSDNPALCLADWIRDDKFGMSEEDDRIDWDKVVTAANVCEETVTVPSGTQDRYTINGTFSAGEQRRSVRDELVNAMMGRLVFSQGLWMMWAGDVVTSDVELTEANLRGRISLQASAGSKDRYNRVRGKFVDASRNYTPSAYPEVRSSAYVTEDGGEVRELVADFTTAQDTYEAQRDAIIILKKSRNQRIVVFEGNYSCFRIQPGSVVTLDIDEFGFASEKFFVTEWKFGQDGIDLTLVEEDDTVWTDPSSPGDYTVRSASGALTFANIGVLPPTALTATGTFDGVQLDWTLPPLANHKYIEVWASDDNDRANAVIIGETNSNRYIEPLVEDDRTRYYWIRAVNDVGATSDYEPDLTTTTASAKKTAPGSNTLIDPDFDKNDGGLGPYWGSNVKQGTGPSQTGSVSLSVGTGENSSDAVDIIWSGSVSGASDLWAITRHRLNGGSFEFRIRYKTVGAGDSSPHELTLQAQGYTAETGGSPTGFSTRVVLPRSASYTEVSAIATFTSVNLYQFFRFGVGVWPVGGTLDTLRIDSIYVHPAADPFGTHLDDASKVLPGLVPEAPSADATNFLRGDGTWAAPASGSGPAGTTDGALQAWDTSVSPDAWVEMTRVRIPTDGDLRVYNSGGTDYIGVDHDGTDATITGFQTTRLNITGFSTGLELDTGMSVRWGGGAGTTQAHLQASDILLEASGTTEQVRVASSTAGVEFLVGTIANPDSVFFVSSASILHSGDTVWTAGNDGAGSGLDADSVDSIPGSNLMTFTGAQVPDLGDIGDVTVVGPVTNDLVYWNGSNWAHAAPGAIPGVGGGGLDNVVEDTTPQLGGTLASNGQDIQMADNDQVQFGNLPDAEIYWNTTRLVVASDDDIEVFVQGNERAMYMTGNGNVILYEDGVDEFRTAQHNQSGQSSGAEVKDHSGDWQDVGFNVIPIYEIDANDSFDVDHQAHMWHKDSGGSVTFTCLNSSDIPNGATFHVANEDTENLTIAQGSGVTIRHFDGGGAAPPTGNRTVARAGFCTVYKYSTVEYWILGGVGVT